MGLAWWLVGLLTLITIVGIPWAKACFMIGQFSLFPFGKKAVARNALSQKEDIGTGALGVFGNVIWFAAFKACSVGGISYRKNNRAD